MHNSVFENRRVRWVCGLAVLLPLSFATGCGKVPTWNELTQQPPAQQAPVVAPASVQPTVAPTPPPKPNATVVLATFRSLKPHEISDATLAELGTLTEGLETVTEINAMGSEITGNGLAHLSKLPALNKLDLSATKVSNEVMEHLTRVPTLESLSLNGTKITDEGISILTGCPNLKKLEIVRCLLTPHGFDAIGKMPVLEEINLDSTTGINDITFGLICNARTLKRFHMNYVGGITDNGMLALSKLEILEELQINECPVTGEALLKTGLKNLKRLSMNRCPITLAGAKAINSCKSLEYLNVAGLGIDDKGFSILTQGLKNLKHLHVASCPNVNGSGLTTLKAADDLEILTLLECGIVDQAMPLLKTHKKLKTLNLRATKVTEKGALLLKKSLPDCEITLQSGKF